MQGAGKCACEPVEPDPVSTGVGSRWFPMQSAVEISMYPLTGDYRPLIQAFIDRLNTYPGLRVATNSLSTQAWGPLDWVMSILAAEMRCAPARAPQSIFVMKVLPGRAPP